MGKAEHIQTFNYLTVLLDWAGSEQEVVLVLQQMRSADPSSHLITASNLWVQN